MTTTRQSFMEKWAPNIDFSPKEQPRFKGLCDLATPFVEWCEDFFTEVRKEPGEVPVNLAMLHLQSEFWSRYESAPASHQRIGGRAGTRHTCLFMVYHSYYLELRELRRKVNPPLIREPEPPPQPPPPPPVPTIAGIPFGIEMPQ